MKKILVLTTGGTIASLQTMDGLKPDNETIIHILYEKIYSLAVTMILQSNLFLIKTAVT